MDGKEDTRPDEAPVATIVFAIPDMTVCRYLELGEDAGDVHIFRECAGYILQQWFVI